MTCVCYVYDPSNIMWHLMMFCTEYMSCSLFTINILWYRANLFYCKNKQKKRQWVACALDKRRRWRFSLFTLIYTIHACGQYLGQVHGRCTWASFSHLMFEINSLYPFPKPTRSYKYLPIPLSKTCNSCVHLFPGDYPTPTILDPARTTNVKLSYHFPSGGLALILPKRIVIKKLSREKKTEWSRHARSTLEPLSGQPLRRGDNNCTCTIMIQWGLSNVHSIILEYMLHLQYLSTSKPAECIRPRL